MGGHNFFMGSQLLARATQFFITPLSANFGLPDALGLLGRRTEDHSQMGVLYVIVGPPAAGKTTTAKEIKSTFGGGGAMIGELLKVANPDDPAKNAMAGVVWDTQHRLAFLGRYAEQFPRMPRLHMEGADRLALGVETGTWSHLLRKGVSELHEYQVLIVDSCDPKVLNANHLARARDAGWTVRVRELQASLSDSMQRCRQRNYSGDGTLTEVEQKWHDDFDGKLAELRGMFNGLDWQQMTSAQMVAEVGGLLENGGKDEQSAAASSSDATSSSDRTAVLHDDDQRVAKKARIDGAATTARPPPSVPVAAAPRAPKDGAPPPGTSRFRCKFPGCHKLYASTDAVRKHCRKRHLEWLRQIDRYSTHEVNITRRENPAPPCLLPCCATPLFKPAALPTVRSRRFRLFPSPPPSTLARGPISLSPKRQRGTPKPALYCVWGDDEVNECGQY